MTIYSLKNNSLQKLEPTTFKDEGILENALQSALKQQIDIVAPNCLVISEEFAEWSGSQRRIDLLAVDKDANLVVIELKRNETGEHMELQALRYAAMVSTLTFSRTIEIYQEYIDSQNSNLDAKNSLLEFFGWEDVQEIDFALDVRIILVAPSFSKELTTSVMWLNEKNIDIRCVRFTPYKYQDLIFLDVQQIIPLPEAESYRIKIQQQSEERRKAYRSSKDYTQYLYKGMSYSKRKLVLQIIHDWVQNKQPHDIQELKSAFPEKIKSSAGPLFVPLKEARDIYERHKKERHFLKDDEIIKFPDGTEYAISNQWSIDSIRPFIEQAKEYGFEIDENP